MKHNLIIWGVAVILGLVLILTAGYFANDKGLEITGNAISISPRADGTYVQVSGVETQEEAEEVQILVDEYFENNK